MAQSKQKYHLHLKGYVGGYDFDSDYVDYILAKYRESEVNVLIDSLGGSLTTALSIVAAFRNHGNVHVHFVGMNASATSIDCPDTPAGIVHAGEWVASQRLTKNPKIRPIIEALDTAQRTNKVGSLSDEYVTKTITAPTVLAKSYTKAQKSPKQVVVNNLPEQSSQSPQSERAFSDYAETMRLLRQRLEEPFVTVNSVTGDISMKKAQDEYAKLIRNKTPKSRR